MEHTLAIIANQNKEAFQTLVQQGEVKETGSGIKYLRIKDKQDDIIR
jgi:hypothetical protein